MAKKKADEKTHVCPHCGGEFDFDVRWCGCCGTHMHIMFRGKGEDCHYCMSGLTATGEKKYGPFKPS